MKLPRKRFIVLFLAVAIAGLLFAFRDRLLSSYFALPQIQTVDQGVTVPTAAQAPMIGTVADHLDAPWDVAFLPDGGILITERGGKLKKLGSDGFEIRVPEVTAFGEGGLLGMVLHPDFVKNHWIYLYSTVGGQDHPTNRVDRYVLDGATLTDRTTIIQGIPAAQYHDGGRLAWGPDGKLYVTTGEATVTSRAQDRTSLGGKILRLNADGTIPDDNPFKNAVWSYGHRNVQGIAWDDKGRMWATEHGRSGVLTGLDELNLIEPGKNYGWPDIQGDETKEGMVTPVINSGPYVTWAPSGMVFLGGKLFFAGLRGQSLYEVSFTGDVPHLQADFEGVYGRLRTAVKGPDGMLYVLTNNTDGRGIPKPGDDRLLRIDPKIFNP